MENKSSDIKDANKTNEAGGAYTGSNHIRIFTSYSESAAEQYLHWARLSPEDRLSEFFVIMSRFYVFTKPNWKGTKIKFNP